MHSFEIYSALQLRDECMTFVTAGHETTSNLLTWLVYQCAGLQPDVWAECKAEVDAELQGNEPDASSLKRLVLCDSVLHEVRVCLFEFPLLRCNNSQSEHMPIHSHFVPQVLRFWPPVPMTARESTCAHTIGGGADGARAIHMPADLAVIVQATQLHRDPALWEQPDEFQPRRFLRQTEHGVRRHLYQYIPFGAGKRMCIGSYFALTEAKLIFAMMLQRFTLTLVPAQTICPVVAVTMRPRHGLLMRCARVDAAAASK